MNEHIRKALSLLLLAVFVTGGAFLLRQAGDNARGGAAYSRALALAAGTEGDTPTFPEETAQRSWVPAPVEDGDPHMEEMAALDLAALGQVNPDVAGWIRIPDSRIDYPLLQGGDNAYYLTHAWDGRSTSVGAIFLERQCSADLTDFHTIVYGHNMNDGSMFAGLRKYASQEYWQNHPYVYIAGEMGVLRYEVFSAYRADVDSITYRLGFSGEAKAEFLRHAGESSKIDTGIVPEETDRILTLSTCSGAGYSTRWVVHARLKMVEAPPA